MRYSADYRPVQFTVLYEANSEHKNVLREDMLGHIRRFEQKLLTLGVGTSTARWDEDKCLKVYPQGPPRSSSSVGKCAAVTSPLNFFSMTAKGKAYTAAQVNSGYSNAGEFASCFCGKAGLCSFCSEGGTVSEDFRSALLDGTRSADAAPSSALKCMLSRLAADAGRRLAPRPEGFANLHNFVPFAIWAKPGRSLDRTAKLSRREFELSFDVRPELPSGEQASSEDSISLLMLRSAVPNSTAGSGSDDSLPTLSFAYLPNSLILRVSFEIPGSPTGQACDVPYELPNATTSRVAASFADDTLVVRVNDSAACRIGDYAPLPRYADDFEIYASSPDPNAPEAHTQLLSLYFKSGTTDENGLARQWLHLGTDEFGGVVTEARGDAVGNHAGGVTVGTADDCKVLCDTTEGCQNIEICNMGLSADSDNRCFMYDSRLSGGEDTKPSSICSAHYAIDDSTPFFTDKTNIPQLGLLSSCMCANSVETAVAHASVASDVLEWMNGFCRKTPDCSWAPPFTHELCSSTGFYHATDSDGLVGLNERAIVIENMCKDGDTSWRNQRRAIFPRSMDCESVEGVFVPFARTTFVAGSFYSDPDGRNAARESQDFYSNYVEGEDGWYDKVIRLKDQVELESFGSLRIMIHSESIAMTQEVEIMLIDSLLFTLALVLLWLYMWWTLESHFLTLCALFQISFALPAAICCWWVFSGHVKLHLMMSLCVITANGVGNIMVMIDSWKQSVYANRQEKFQHWTFRFAWSFRRSFRLLACTSLSAVVALVLCAISPLEEVRQFCIFSAIGFIMEFFIGAPFFMASIVVYERLFNWSRPESAMARQPGACGGPGCCFGCCRMAATELSCKSTSQPRRYLLDGEEVMEKRCLETFFEGSCFSAMKTVKVFCACLWSAFAIAMAMYCYLELDLLRKPEFYGRASYDLFRGSEILRDEYSQGKTVAFVFGLDVGTPMLAWGDSHEANTPQFAREGIQNLTSPVGQNQLLELCRLADFGQKADYRCGSPNCLISGRAETSRCERDPRVWRTEGVNIPQDPLCEDGRYCFMEELVDYLSLPSRECYNLDREASCRLSYANCMWKYNTRECNPRVDEDSYPTLSAAEFLKELRSEGFAEYLEKRDRVLRAMGRGAEADAYMRHTGFKFDSMERLQLAWITFNATFPPEVTETQALSYYNRWEAFRLEYASGLGAIQTSDMYAFLAVQEELPFFALYCFGGCFMIAGVWSVYLGNALLSAIGFLVLASSCTILLSVMPMIGMAVGPTQCFFLTSSVALIGQHLSFVLNAYQRSPKQALRKERVREALGSAGISITNSAVALLLAGGAVFGCGYNFFFMQGLFLLAITLISALTSLTMLAPILMVIGPEGDFGMWNEGFYGAKTFSVSSALSSHQDQSDEVFSPERGKANSESAEELISVDIEAGQHTAEDEAEVERFRAIFKLFDSDMDGMLNRNQLCQALYQSMPSDKRSPLSQKEADELLAGSSVESSGSCDFEEFRRVVKLLRSQRSQVELDMTKGTATEVGDQEGTKKKQATKTPSKKPAVKKSAKGLKKGATKLGLETEEAEDTDGQETGGAGGSAGAGGGAGEDAATPSGASEEAEGEIEKSKSKTPSGSAKDAGHGAKVSVKTTGTASKSGKITGKGAHRASTELPAAPKRPSTLSQSTAPSKSLSLAPNKASATPGVPSVPGKPGLPGLPNLPPGPAAKAAAASGSSVATMSVAGSENSPKQVASQTSMMTAAAASAEAAAASEAAPKKKGNEALAHLKDLLADASVTEEALAATIAEARAAGADDRDLQAAEQRIGVIKATKVVDEAVASRDVSKLKEAIAAAESKGAGEELLAKGRSVLQEEESKMAEADKKKKEEEARKAAAIDALKKAIASHELTALREAIAGAEKESISGDDLVTAKKVLEEEEKKQKARDELAALRECGDVAKLEAGLAAARAAGLAASEPLLAEIEGLKAGAVKRDAAQAELTGAVAALDLERLRAAIEAAKVAGVDASEVEKAQKALEEEEPKVKAREQLKTACEACTKDELAAAIEAAKAAKLQESEYAEATELLRKEEEKERQLAALKQSLEDSKTIDMTSIDVVRAAKEALSEAITTATAAGVPEVAIKEAEIRRKKLHNTVEDLKGSIRVFCRIRPLSSKEKDAGDLSCTHQTDPMTLEVKKEEGEVETFQFDSVWTPGTQDEIFEDCRDLVQSAVDGYNVTLFAYGQTGAGKTFTMAGVPGMLGVSPRTITEIFEVIERGKNRFDYEVTGSMLELYRQDLIDLLSKGDEGKVRKKALNVRQEKSGSVIIENLTEETCKSAEELAQVLERGNEQRTVAATAMNSESSRSHLVLVIKILSTNKETKEVLKGKILIVDLAGSERLKKSQTTAEMQKESIEINKSLTALGDVIEALTKNQKTIPYRNHKLTQLMQDSLGGSAKTLMFVNCSPANSNCDETIMSLKYAARAKKITNNTKGPNSS